MVRATGDAYALFHVGFARPDTHDVQALLHALTPGFYVTEAARYAVPREFAVGVRAVGVCQGRDLAVQPVYRAIGEWLSVHLGVEGEAGEGNQAAVDAGHPDPLDAPPVGPRAWWIARLGESDPEAVAVLEREGVRTEDDYRQVRARLSAAIQSRVDRHLFRALTEGLPLVDPFVIAGFLPDWALQAPLRALGLSQRCTNVFRNARLEKVADVIALGPIGVMELRNFGRTSLTEFTERLYQFVASVNEGGDAHPPRLVSGAGAVAESAPNVPEPERDDLEPAGEAKVEPAPEPRSLRAALDSSLSSLRERDAEALRLWLGVDGPPMILEDIGGLLGVTRERARQLRNRAWDRIRDRYRWPHDVAVRLECLLHGRTDPLYLDLIAADDAWFDGFQENLVALGRVIEDLASETLHVWSLNGRLIATHCPAEHWPELAEAARAAVEREIPAGVTRADAQVLIQAVAIGEGTPDLAEPLWERLLSTLHFAVSQPGEERLVSIGRGLRHALAAILDESDRPLYMSEIIERLYRRGFVKSDDYATQNMVRSAMREAGGVLYGRSVYGLEKHLPVSPEVAEEALAELEAIFLEGVAGRQWHCSELADVLAARRPDLGDELDQFVVNVILGRSSRLTYLKRLVWVGSRRLERLQDRLDVAAMCEAALLEAGRPLSKRELRESIQRVRGLNQHFLPQASERVVRLAHGMWGLADRDVGVSAENQRAALEALSSVLERRQKGLHVSELFNALGEVGFAPDPALDAWELLGIAQSDPRFRVGRGQLVGLAAWADVRRRAIGQALAELQAPWSGPISGDELYRAVCALIERAMPRASVASCAARAGFVYDASTGLWDLAEAEQSDMSAAEDES